MKCFYYSADLDGHCSGAIIKNIFPECEMIGINYGQPFPFDIITDPLETVFMVDFGIQPFSEMEKLNGMCELHWIDHHKTAIDDAYHAMFLASGGMLLFDGKSGCELTWEYMIGFQNAIPEKNPEPLIVHHLGRYDVWDHSDPDTLPLQYGMRLKRDTLPESKMWIDLLRDNAGVPEIVEAGKTIMEYEKLQNEKFCKAYAFETEIDGKLSICINRGFTNSQIFDSIYNPEKHHYMVTFCRLKPPAGKWTVSLYSTRGDIDCGVVAKSFGGGGHKGAAGFQCEELPFKI